MIDRIRDPRTTASLLRKELRRLGLVVRGRKHELVERLVEHHNV